MYCTRFVSFKMKIKFNNLFCFVLGVIRLTFNPLGSRRIARFDLTMGSQIQGFTFNFGDSSTKNGYGGEGGTTSNSAEIHSNDNRFYVNFYRMKGNCR